MKKKLDQWSLVIVGGWNPAILSPTWLAKEVFRQEEIGILFPVLGAGPPIFQTKDIRMVVSPESITFMPLKDSDDILNRIEMAARHILATLHHTPIVAFGENFQYTEDECPPALIQGMKFWDMESLATEGAIGEVSLIRSISLPSSCQLNLKLVFNGSCRVDLNYHYAVAPALGTADAVATQMTNTYVPNRNHGIELLKKVYNFQLDEVTSDDND
jgi:hypothetical protein